LEERCIRRPLKRDKARNWKQTFSPRAQENIVSALDRVLLVRWHRAGLNSEGFVSELICGNAANTVPFHEFGLLGIAQCVGHDDRPSD